MPTYTFATPCRTNKLMDELQAAGLTVPYCAVDDGQTVVTVTTAAEAQVTALVAAHDPTTPSASEQADTALRADMQDYRQTVQAMLTALDAADTQLATAATALAATGTWAGLTATQRTDRLRQVTAGVVDLLAQQTTFNRRILRALAALVRRLG